MIVTPEAVPIVIDTAGLGSRMIALAADMLIQGAVLLALTIPFVVIGHARGLALVVFLLALFLVLWGYFPLFETLWGGRTPGKRMQGLRVVRTDGQPAGVGPVLARNVIRLVDFLPGMYAVGVATILLSSRNQRLGDLAAGTIVIRERRAPEPSPLNVMVGAHEHLDTAGLTQRDYVVIRDFLQRRGSFDPTARGELARSLATAYRGRVGGAVPAADEIFLERLAASFRDRSSGGPA